LHADAHLRALLMAAIPAKWRHHVDANRIVMSLSAGGKLQMM